MASLPTASPCGAAFLLEVCVGSVGGGAVVLVLRQPGKPRLHSSRRTHSEEGLCRRHPTWLWLYCSPRMEALQVSLQVTSELELWLRDSGTWWTLLSLFSQLMLYKPARISASHAWLQLMSPEERETLPVPVLAPDVIVLGCSLGTGVSQSSPGGSGVKVRSTCMVSDRVLDLLGCSLSKLYNV